MAVLRGLRPVGDDDLDSTAPLRALLDEKAGQRCGVAMFDHGQDLAGVAGLEHRDVAVTFTHRRLVHQQDPAATGTAMLGHGRRPRRDERLDQMPVDAVAAHHRANRHHLRVRDQAPGQTPRETTFDLGAGFEVAFIAIGTGEPVSDPHQRHAPPRYRQVTDLTTTAIMDRSGLEPAMRAMRPRPDRGHLETTITPTLL